MGLLANQETRQVSAANRYGGIGGKIEFYEYHNGEFILVAYEYRLFRRDSETDKSYLEVTRTDVRTGEITVEIIIG